MKPTFDWEPPFGRVKIRCPLCWTIRTVRFCGGNRDLLTFIHALIGRITRNPMAVIPLLEQLPKGRQKTVELVFECKLRRVAKLL